MILAEQLIGLVVVVVIAVVGYYIWDKRYHGAPDGAFQPTAEIFTDPSTGKRMRVYEDPKTGKRQYREEPA